MRRVKGRARERERLRMRLRERARLRSRGLLGSPRCTAQHRLRDSPASRARSWRGERRGRRSGSRGTGRSGTPREPSPRSRGTSRRGGSPRTVDSLLRKHTHSGRIARVRRGLYVSVPPGGSAETAGPYLVATKAVEDAAVSHHAALQFCQAPQVWDQGCATNSGARGRRARGGGREARRASAGVPPVRTRKRQTRGGQDARAPRKSPTRQGCRRHASASDTRSISSESSAWSKRGRMLPATYPPTSGT